MENENKDAVKARTYTQEETRYTTLSAAVGQACANCRWFNTYGDEYNRQDTCHIVRDFPNAIEPTGWCDHWEAQPEEPISPVPVVIVEDDAADKAADDTRDTRVIEAPADAAAVTVAAPDAALKGAVERLIATLKDALPKLSGKETMISGFKVYKDADGKKRWLAHFSNNFFDRDGEAFSEKGIDAFIARLDMGVVPMPELWSWHTPGTRYGQADWVDRIGHFVVASGTYDATPTGDVGAAYDAKHAHDYGVSHGFLFNAKGVRVVDGKRVYDDFNTFEISPLPKGKEANVYTSFAVEGIEKVEESTMNEAKRQHLEAKFGKDFVDNLVNETEERGKAIEALAAYKDFVHPEGDIAGDEKAGTVPSEEAALFKEFLPDMLVDMGEAVAASLAAVKEVTALRKDMDALKAENAALKEQLDGRPRRASKAPETALEDADPVVAGIVNEEKRAKTQKAFPGLYGANGAGDTDA